MSVVVETENYGLDETTLLTNSLEQESNELWKSSPGVAIATLFIPVIAATAAAGVAFTIGGAALVRRLALAVVASAIAGRFIIWTGTQSDTGIGFSAAELATMVFVLDIVWAVVLTWHSGVLFRVPYIGPHLKTAVQEGNLLLKQNRWMRRMTLVAVFGFVMLPVSSTGSIGGSLLGRLLGLNRLATFLTVVCGSVVGGLLMLKFAETLAPWFEQHGPAVQYGTIAALILLGVILSRRYRSALQ